MGKLQGIVDKLRDEMRAAEKILEDKRREQIELLQRISDNLYSTLNSRETKAMLTRMPHPNKKLEKLAQATVMFLEGGSRKKKKGGVEVPDWKHCQSYLITHGFR